MKRAVVIGLGIFGANIVKQLFESGLEVIAIDKTKDAVQRVKDFSTKAIIADGTDKDIMDSIGIREDDVVIISFGEDLAASTLITAFFTFNLSNLTPALPGLLLKVLLCH